jgi:ABC-type enterochelin transport system substrate-binding protein
MEPVYIPVVVALIGGPVMWFLSRFDKRNTEQHGKNMEALSRIEGKQDRLDSKVDRIDAKVDRLDERVTNMEKPKVVRKPVKKSV